MSAVEVARAAREGGWEAVASTETECCGARTEEPGHIDPNTLHCPRCERAAWMAQGYTLTHERGAVAWLPTDRVLGFMRTQMAKR